MRLFAPLPVSSPPPRDGFVPWCSAISTTVLARSSVVSGRCQHRLPSARLGPARVSAAGLVLALWVGLALVGAPARAWNENGVLLLHTDDAVSFTKDQDFDQRSGLDCAQGEGEIDCAARILALDPTSGRGSENVVWWAFVAFPPETDPWLRAVALGHRWAGALVVLDYGLGPNMMDVPDPTWPFESGSGVGVAWRDPQTTHLTEIYWMAGYTEEATILELIPHHGQGGAVADDWRNIEPLIAYGRLGLGGAEGWNPPVVTPLPSETEAGPGDVVDPGDPGGNTPVGWPAEDESDPASDPDPQSAPPSLPWGPRVPTRLDLRLETPNPCRHAAMFALDVPAASEGRLAIYDASGRQIWSFGIVLGPGAHTVPWNGQSAGGSVRSGVYWAVLRTREDSRAQRIVLLP